MFRKPAKKDIDQIVDFITEAAASGHFDPVLARKDIRSKIRKDMISIMKRGRRTDRQLCAQLLIWEVDGKLTGFFINSAVVAGNRGNEIYMTGVLPEYRGHGEGMRMKKAIINELHPKVDIISRCHRVSERSFRINTRLGFRTIRTTQDGVRIMFLPRFGRAYTGKLPPQEKLDPFIKIEIR